MGLLHPPLTKAPQSTLAGDFSFSGTINPEGLVGQLFLAVDRSGTSTNNNIYMMASVQPTGASNGTDVMFVRSTNGGLTFSAPQRVNDDPVNHNKWHWLGTFAVAPNGRIDSVWLDTRNAANNTDSQLFYSYSTDGAIPGRPISRSAIRSIRSSVIRTRTRWAITSQLFQTIPEAMSRMPQRSISKKTFITFASLQQRLPLPLPLRQRPPRHPFQLLHPPQHLRRHLHQLPEAQLLPRHLRQLPEAQLLPELPRLLRRRRHRPSTSRLGC